MEVDGEMGWVMGWQCTDWGRGERWMELGDQGIVVELDRLYC